MIDRLQDIIPALTGFFFGLIVLVYFVFKKNYLGMVISSISCILLMFIFEIISVNFNFNEINSFFEKTKNIFDFPLVTILVTTVSIFLGNFLIKYFVTDRKEKKEFATLFINALKFHINVLERVFSQIDLPKLRTKDSIVTEGREYIEIYKSNLIEEKGYDVAFNKIGIFNENEIDLVYRYRKQLKESLLYIDIFCCTMSKDTEIYDKKPGKIKLKNITNTEKSNLIKSFIDIKIFVPITIVLGYLCIYELSLNYLPHNLTKDRENFLESAKFTYNALLVVFWDSRIFRNYYFNNKTFHILNRITSDTLIETLNYTRERYRKIDKAKDTNNRQPIYLFRVLINSQISLEEGQIDDYTWNPQINFISSQETFINLTWEIPDTNLVNSAKKMLKNYITQKVEQVEESYEINLFLKENIDEFIENCECESYIISPWGIDIDSLKMKFSQI